MWNSLQSVDMMNRTVKLAIDGFAKMGMPLSLRVLHIAIYKFVTFSFLVSKLYQTIQFHHTQFLRTYMPVSVSWLRLFLNKDFIGCRHATQPR
jgi:hypothetical protein